MVHTSISNLHEFALISDGRKTSDLRKEEKPYTEGDTIVFQERDEHSGLFTGNEISVAVTNVVRSTKTNGLKQGFVMVEIRKGLATSTVFNDGYGKQATPAAISEEKTDTAAEAKGDTSALPAFSAENLGQF